MLVVGGAVYYLARKLLGVSGKKKVSSSFVPMSHLRRRR